MKLPDTVLAAFLLSGPVLVAPAFAQEFVEVPGEMEFSGVMIARPLQPEEASGRGLDRFAQRRLTEVALRTLAGLRVRNYFPEVDEYLVEVPAGDNENSLSQRLMATGAFQYVHPDWTVYPIACPNDSGFATQWHHNTNRMESCSAWNIETGSPTVVVAICDTGVRTSHADLQLHRRTGYNVTAALWENQGGAISDVNGHGTNCTGSAAGNGNNSIGISGVGWNLGHRMMRVTDSSTGSASLSKLTTAARVAADAGDRVASVSYSGVNSSSVFTTGTYVRSRNALLVWAAGNSNVVLSGNRNDDVIVVGASDQNDAKASFSNYGSLVDLVAPGVSIYTTSNSGDTSYASVSGTSFACPITAGLCGLIWSRNPTLTPAQVESILRSSCEDLGTAGVDDTFGYGRINSYLALSATPGTGGPDVTPPPIPSALVATAAANSVSLSWGASSVPDLAGYRVYRSTTSGSGYVEVTTALLTTTSFVNSGLTAGTTYHFVVRAQDTTGNISGNSNQASATPYAPNTPLLLFSDGFESGNFSVGGWVVQNNRATVTSSARFAGSFGARLARSTWIEKARSTAGFVSVELRWTRRTFGLDTGELSYAEWWNGTAWVLVESTNSTTWGSRAVVLPAAAANKANFKFRFRNAASASDEWTDLDEVQLWGTP
ncbi:MAG: hypothetical protein FJ298_11600 [Planctomycetes bacterium]|nr:hypothetical protein [Planctomycetota bacterium]